MFDRFKRALVRLSGRPATSVPPKTGQAANPQLAELIARLTEFNDDIRTRAGAVKLLDGPHPWNEGLPTPQPNPDPNVKVMYAPIAIGPDTPEWVKSEIDRRLNALDLDEGLSADELAAIVQAQIADLPGVRLAGVIRAGDPGYDEALARYTRPQESQSHPFKDGVSVEHMPWSIWQKWMVQVKAPPGWSPCRFGARMGNASDDDAVGQMFGFVRCEFGVYTKPFYVCHPVHAEQSLAALIHLPTGTGVGVFMTEAMATEAGELALALGGVDWRGDIDPTNPDKWNGIRERVGAAWSAAGLHVAPFHAHDNDTEGEITVWMSTHHTRTAGKPTKEKLQ